jgi:DNA-binding NarL/FixJ family response regulator
MPTVSIIEDHPEVSKWIQSQFLNHKNWNVNGCFSSAESAFNGIVNLTMDLIILDVGLPNMSGIDALPKLKSLKPKAKILIYTVFEDEETILKAITQGCHGYWIKDLTRGLKFVDECEQLIEGGASLTPKVARYLMEKISKESVLQTVDLILSKRENEVLNMIAVGFKIADIADELDISSHTIRHTLERIYQKLNVGSKQEAILKGNRLGIIQKPDGF